MMSTKTSSSSPLLTLLSIILILRHLTNAAEYHICGTSYMNAEQNCRTNPKCFNGQIAVGTPPSDCPVELPTCFTILSTEELCGDGLDIQLDGGGVATTTTATVILPTTTTLQEGERTTVPPWVPTTTMVDATAITTNIEATATTIPEISDPLFIEPIPDTTMTTPPPLNDSIDGTNNNLATTLANNLHLSIQMRANFNHNIDCASYFADWSLCYIQTFTFRYTGLEDYTNVEFKIYFSSIHRVLHVDHPDFEYGHVMGDLTYITPTASFEGFMVGEELTLPLVFEYWSVQESDTMPRFFVVDSRDNSTAIIPNTDTESLHDFVIPYSSSMKTESDANVPMTVENRYKRNEQMVIEEGWEGTDTSTRIIPTPLRVEISESAQTFTIFGVSLVNDKLLGQLKSGAEDLISKITMKPTSTTEYSIMLVIGTLPEDIAGTESYMMEIKVQGATITASHAAGLFYGVMSFLGLLDISNSDGTMPVKEMMIYDKPRFAYRGHQIDSARNFRTNESVMRTIDAMALYKLNNLHFGLSNDEGWRLEIPGMEELTTIGSRRCFDLSEETCILTQLGSGPDASDEPQFYTVADFVEILRYAEARNVKIAPEFNMPGHARAAVVSMEARARKGDDSLRLMDPDDETELLTVQFYDRSSIINPCLDSSVRFVEKLVDEVMKMYAEAQLGLEVWQFGGDEAKNILLGGGYAAYYDLPKEVPFSKSPACIKKMQEDPTINVDTDAANYWALVVNKILAQKGIREMVAWEDGLNGMTKEEFEINEVSVNFRSTLFWGATDALVEASKTGFGVIMANPDYLYFDFPYEVHPEERGYYWGARENSVAKVFSFAPENLPQNAETSLDRDGNAMNVTTPVWPAPAVKGMQGQTWSETVRTETQHEEMTYPRVLAVAERAWHRGSWELDWTPNQNYHATSDNVPKDQLAMDFKGFNTVLGCREVRKIWQRLAIKYRVPPPGATIEAGILTANSELPCTRIQYSIDGGMNWSEYLSPVDLGEGKFVSLKSLSADGVLESRIVDIDQEECVGCQEICESNPLMPFNTPQICSIGNSSAITLPPLESYFPTFSPSAPKTLLPDTTSCIFCEEGILDFALVPPDAGGNTCGELQQTAASFFNGDESCNVIQSLENLCCNSTTPLPSETNTSCAFCDGGIPDLALVPPETGGQTCGDVKQTAASHMNEDELCKIIQSIESTCCPEPVDPCVFCEGGILDLAVVPSMTGGQSCGEVLQIAAQYSKEDETCNTILASESTCCPEPNATAALCSFCEGGIPNPTNVPPGAGGQTCEEVQQTATLYINGDVTCNNIQSIESVCCGASLCAFCEGGIPDLAVVPPDAGGKSCEELQQTAALYVDGDETCNMIQNAESTCCPKETMASKLADALFLKIHMDSNFDHGIDCASYQADWSLCYYQYFIFDYTGNEAYTDNNFSIYFSSIHRVLHVDHPDFEYGHVVGDLTYIKPTASFKGFEAESEMNLPLILPLVFEYWSVQESDTMPRFFVVDSRDNSTAMIPNTDTENLHDFVAPYQSSKKTEGDANVPMTAENRYRKNEKLLFEGKEIDTSTRIIPTPFRVEISDSSKTFGVEGVTLINADLLGQLKSGAEDLISKITTKQASDKDYTLILTIGTLPEDISGTESYMMEITAEGTTITASEKQGLFYGVMSFLGLLDISNSRGTMPLKEMMIYDKPRFAYRGHQIDSARNFRTNESVMRTIDAMALYKLNNLHFGLSNDEGWRLEIPGMEELTTIGSRRCFDLSEETCILTQLGSGPDASDEPQFYTVADFVEILRYAEARNVKIAPEFNMPGHARAAVVSMEARARKGDDSLRLMDPDDETELLTVQFYDRSSIINPCLDSSVRFVEKLVDEVMKMYAEAQLGLEVWQFGGDEAKNILLGGGYAAYYDLPKEVPFSKSPACIKKMQEDPTINVDTDAANYWALVVNKILAQKGIREMVAWEDGLNGMTKEEFEINEVSVNFRSTLFWGATDALVEASKTGFGVIMANPDYLYFDFPYEVHPEERGYYWGARENSVAKVFSFAPENLPQNAETSLDRDGNAMNVTTPVWPAPAVKGMQGQTWSETVRTETQHEEMTYPRVLAVAERAWHRGSWELDWTPNQNYHATSDNVPKDQLAMDFKGFNTVLGCREVRKIWQRLAIKYRVPPPGVTIEAGILTANSELPCTRIQYSIDGGMNWSEYLSPVDLGEGKFVSLKSLSADGVLESRIVDIDQEECVGCQEVCGSNPLMPFNTSQICIGGSANETTSSPSSASVTLPPLASGTNTISESDGTVALYKNPDGNDFFCGETFSTVAQSCLSSQPCPGGVSGVCDDHTRSNHQGCFKVSQCTAEYKAAGAVSTEENNTQQGPSDIGRCRICGEVQIHAENTVLFEGEEFPCREFDGVFDQGGIDAESTSCILAKELYADTCCIKSDGPNVAPSPSVFDGGEYPTLWIYEHSGVAKCSLAFVLGTIMTFFFFMSMSRF